MLDKVGSRRNLLPILAVLLIAALLYGGNLNDARTLTTHESYPAAAARDMLATGNWLVPMDGNHTWLEKPPLLQWLDAIGLIVFHNNTEWVIRLPSVIAGLVLIATISLLALRWFGPAYGFAAGFIQTTSYYAFTYARLGEADMLLAATVALATYMFVTYQGIALERPGGSRRLFAFWCLVGVASLTKGVGYGSAMAMLPAVSWLIARRDRQGLRRMMSRASAIGIPVGLCIALAWPTLMLATQPGYAHGWLMNTLGRAMGETPLYDQPWWYYASMMPGQVAPWTPLTVLSLWLAVRLLVKHEPGRRRDIVVFCLLWTFVPVCLLSLSDGKHHQYLLPCLPGLTLLSCIGLERTAQAFRAGERWVHVFSVLLLLFAAAMVALTLYPVEPYARLYVSAFAMAGGAVCMALFFSVFAAMRRAWPGFGVMVIGFSALLVTIHFDLQPKLDGRRQDRAFFESVSARVPPGDRIIATGWQFVARPIFLIQRRVIGIWAPGKVVCDLPRHGVAYVVAKRRYDAILRRTMHVREIAASRHSNEETGPEDRWALMRVTRKKGLHIAAICNSTG